MRNINYTITAANLNTGTEQETDIEITENGNLMRADQILINNVTGASLGYIILENDAEKTNRVANPTHYDFVPLETGKNYFNLDTPKYIIIKKLSGTASADLEMYCINYQYK